MHSVTPGQIYTLKNIPVLGITARGLAKKFGLNHTTTMKQINTMELKGLVNVERRMGKIGNCITVSKLGRKILNEMESRPRR